MLAYVVCALMISCVCGFGFYFVHNVLFIYGGISLVFLSYLASLRQMSTEKALTSLRRPATSRALAQVQSGQIADTAIKAQHLSAEVLALLGGNGVVIDDHMLTAQDITNKYFDLPSAPVDAESLVLTVADGTEQQLGEDYAVSGARVTWDPTDPDVSVGLVGVLVEGDVLLFTYLTS